jgi:hypothetical protein
MRLIAVTTCTNRKKFPVPEELDASVLRAGPQSVVANAWRKRVKSALAVGRATDVYCGRSFQEAAQAARTGGADFRIISGGLGLIRADDAIPSYSLSLVRQSSEFIGARVLDEPFDASRWWGEIQQAPATTPLAKMLRANPDSIIVIGISNSYLPLVGKDLASLDEDDLDRVRLIGMGIEDACPLQLRRCILPYDDRLDGPDSTIPGTRGDFSSRAMRHFIEHVLAEHQSRSIDVHKTAVKRSLSRWRRPKSISRPSKTDDEIIRLIKKNWKRIEGKSSMGLRYLRDIEKIACEQGRFRILFHRAAKQVTS